MTVAPWIATATPGYFGYWQPQPQLPGQPAPHWQRRSNTLRTGLALRKPRAADRTGVRKQRPFAQLPADAMSPTRQSVNTTATLAIILTIVGPFLFEFH